MYLFLLHLHSILRYAVLAGMLYVIYLSFLGYNTKNISSKKAKKYSKLSMVVMHSQILIGLILYFISPKVVFNAETMKHMLSRFFALEHPFIMILAAVAVTVGHIMAKNNRAMRSHKLLFWFYLGALVLLFIGIPWPFRSIIGGGWL